MFPSCPHLLAVALALCSIATAAKAQLATGGWTKIGVADGGLSEAKLRAMSAAVRSEQFKKIGSVLIAHHGKLVYEDYVEGDTNTLRDTRSASKSITDVLIGIAIQEGKLSGVDAKVLALLPDHVRRLQNPDPRKSMIAVEDFLTMSSPLECDDWNDASRGNEERMYLVEDWTQFILDLPIRGRMHVGEQVEPPPYGRFFSYCTGGVFVLSEILEKATGLRADRYAQQMLFAPLGITNAQWVYSPLNIPLTGGGLRLNSRDLLKIGQLCLDGGRWQGRQIVKPRMGTEFDSAPCAHRRSNRLRISLVAQVVQVRREELPGILYVWKWREQSCCGPPARHRSSDYEHKLQHAGHARAN